MPEVTRYTRYGYYSARSHDKTLLVSLPHEVLGGLDGEGLAALDEDLLQHPAFIVGGAVHPDHVAQVDLAHRIHVSEILIDVVTFRPGR